MFNNLHCNKQSNVLNYNIFNNTTFDKGENVCSKSLNALFHSVHNDIIWIYIQKNISFNQISQSVKFTLFNKITVIN